MADRAAGAGIPFQKSVSYAGGAATPKDLVTVAIEVPVAAYTQSRRDEVVVRRLTDETRTATVTQPANRRSYAVAVDDTVVNGDNPDLAWQYALAAAERDDVGGLTFPMTVTYRSGDDQYLGEQLRQVLILPLPLWDRSIERDRDAERARPWFVADAQLLASLRVRWSRDVPEVLRAPLAMVLFGLTVLGDDGPELSEAWTEVVTTWLGEILGAPEAATRIVERLKTSHPALVDVALTIPLFGPLTIAGDLVVRAPAGREVTGRDLATFEIVAEWTGAQDRVPHRLEHRLAPDTSVAEAKAAFALTTGRTIYRSTVADPVRVSVRGLDGAALWKGTYAPEDPILERLTIEVPLQAPGELTRPPGNPADKNLRLRGRVVVLDDGCTCTTADVLVLVQAKATAADPWRVVGAATADSAGNFGMAYPFGAFVEAQAVVSLAPADATPVPVDPARADRSISADFLYLLVRHPRRTKDSDGEDGCGCETSKPDRLPDFADLIGSEVYSQDIGGSCVNLSTPNRTINEFPFGAVVRTSDPDVGTYRLVRREVGLEAVDIAQVAALRGGAASLTRTSTAALDQARQSHTGSPNTGTRLVLDAMEAVHPHVLAIDAALGTPPVALPALGVLENHVDSVVATLEAARDRAAREDLGFPTPVYTVIDAATSLRPLVRVAIDSVGPSTRYELTGESTSRDRRPIDLANPVLWQPDAAIPAEPPSGQPPAESVFAQAVSVATGHLLHYKALFKADGYSLGDLVYSLPLAPGQKKEIVVFDAAQTLAGAETQTLSQNERLAMGLVDERTITSTLAGAIGESIDGSSSARTSGFSAGGGVAAQVSGSTGVVSGSAGGVLGVAGGNSQSSSNARQQGSRDVAQFFGEKLRQAIMQNAEGYRQLNATVVTSVQQGQRYGVTSEVIANHNHCHSLTMMYFEVLRHYAIFQELSSVEECVFVPFLLARFTTENVATWRDVLAPTLLPLPAETYLQPFVEPAGPGRRHPLVKAFDAVTRLRTNYANVDLPVGSYDQEPIRFMKGTLDLRVSVPRPRTRYDRITSLPVVSRRVTTDEIDLEATAKKAAAETVAAGLTLGLSLLFTGGPSIEYKEADVLVKKALFDAFMTMDANYESVRPADCIRVTNFTPTGITMFGFTIPLSGLDFFADAGQDRDRWTRYASVLGYNDVFAMLRYYFQGRLISEWDRIFYEEIAPAVFDEAVRGLRLTEFSIDRTPQDPYTGGDRIIRVTMSGTTAKARSALPAQLQLTVDAPSVTALRKDIVLNVHSLRLEYSTPHYNGLLYAGAPADDLLDGVTLDIPENPDEKRNPRREDRYLAAALIEHLNSNLEHYNKVLWSRLDPDRRFMLLDASSIQIFSEDGTPVPGPAGLRSLASVVKNDVVAVAGNSLVFPVAPGYRVSGALITPTPVREEEAETTPTLLDHYRPLTPVPPFRISVPTQGVFVEAVQGACNACERIEPDRLQDWSRFPIDEPSEISPVVLPTPTPQNWQPQYRDFAAPIVSVQNAPGSPAPGAGLAGLSELLGKAEAFRDLTGLDANQQNAIRTYLSNQENAKAFAEMAKELATQNHNSRNSRTIMEGIQQAERTEAINKEEAGTLVKDHLQQQIDGGSGKRAQVEADQMAAATPISRAAVEAAGRGQEVEATRQDADGNHEHVTIRGGEGAGGVVEVRGTVPALRQEKRMDCWAVAAAMLLTWHKPETVTPERAATAAGQRYRRMYLDDTGLPAADKDDFLLRSQMVAEAPASYALEQYITWLRAHGPLWITVDARPDETFSPHARVLTRIAGTGVEARMTFLDPAPRSGGEVTQTFAEFVRGYEQMVIDNRSDVLFPQVVHVIDKIDGTEGFQIEGPLNINEPVHETVTLASLLEAGIDVPETEPGADAGTDEFLRGIIWNDDPAILLFEEDDDDNWNFTTGAAWFVVFKWAKFSSTNRLSNLTGRSHFFDLQFLHAMAEQAGEEPGDTLSKILMWAEVMYRLSIGEGVAATDKLAEVDVTSSVTVDGTDYTAALSGYFTGASAPTGQDTLGFLLTQDTAFGGLDLERRAIGSLLHMVQDSYARGHVKRTLENPGDLVAGSEDTFKPGTYGRYGAVENFHCYRGQDSKAHDKYDEPPEGMRPTSLESFNPLVGARNAITAGTRLLTMWQDQTPWGDPNGPEAYLRGTVFALSPNVTPADATV